MNASRRFRFGVINERMTTAGAWIDAARRTEAQGYATFLIRDHFVPDHFGDQFAPFSALTAAACATTTLRVGCLVIDNDYRHPVVLAKEAATLDLLSGGRFELGLGAGFMKTEYDKAGIAFDAPGIRVSRLAEAIDVLKGLFGAAPLTFQGQHYRIDGLNGYPKPAQHPHPPIHIGAGSKRMLMLAGRHANTVGLLGRHAHAEARVCPRRRGRAVLRARAQHHDGRRGDGESAAGSRGAHPRTRLERGDTGAGARHAEHVPRHRR